MEKNKKASGAPHLNQEAIKSVVKSVLIDSDILNESLAEKVPAIMASAEISQYDLDKIKTDLGFIESISEKVSQIITNNDDFRQVICDSVSLAMEDQIKQLKNSVKELQQQNQNLENQIEEQAQYSRRNCLIVHGLQVSQNENTDQLVMDTFQRYLGITVKAGDSDRSHWLNSPKKPIIVKFISHNLKQLIYNNKKKLKGTQILITEALIKKRKECLVKLATSKKDRKVLSYWTYGGKIYFTKAEAPIEKILLKSISPEDINIG